MPVGTTMPVCGGVEAYNDPYVLSIVAKGHRLCFTSPPLLHQAPLGNTISQWSTEDSGNARANIPNASVYSRVLFEHIPVVQGFWRVASSSRLETTERPHRRASLSHAHYKLSAEYCRKRRICIQNTLAGCVLSSRTAGCTFVFPSKTRYIHSE